MDISTLRTPDLLTLFGEALNELRAREVLRTNNNPTGDYGELLASKAVDAPLADKSTKGYDLLGADGVRYQVKARRVTEQNPSRQLGVIRNIEDKSFDFLVGIILDARYRVVRGCSIPYNTVKELAQFKSHQNGHVMHLQNSVWEMPGVKDLTEQLRCAAANLSPPGEGTMIPNWALKPEDVPFPPDDLSEWSDWMTFAGTFNGYEALDSGSHNIPAIISNHFRTEFEECGRRDDVLPDSITIIRACLFAEWRGHHFSDCGGGLDPSQQTYVAGLVRRLRAILDGSLKSVP